LDCVGSSTTLPINYQIKLNKMLVPRATLAAEFHFIAEIEGMD